MAKLQHLNLKTRQGTQTETVLYALVAASSLVFLIVGITGLYWADWRLLSVSVVGIILQAAPLILIRNRRLGAAAFILMLSVLGTTVVMASIGQGSRDVAVLAFPIIFIFAALVLNRRLFVLTVGLALVASAWLVFGQTFGWYVPQPFQGAPGWPEFLTLAVILILAAFATDLLATNMRKSLAVAHEEIERRKKVEEEREKLVASLKKALGEIKTLNGLIPMCANCKKIRDDKGYWQSVERYIGEHSDASFSHGICPECLKKLYPDLPPE
jgi:MFS family permease